jgi:hypothetical protein
MHGSGGNGKRGHGYGEAVDVDGGNFHSDLYIIIRGQIS